MCGEDPQTQDSRLEEPMAVIPPASTEAATFLTELRNSGNTLGVLVIGEAGTGKTTLIVNLQLNSQETAGLVTVYDTSGLETARDAWEKIKNGKHDKWVVILCIPLTETRMRASLINSFKEYHDLGIEWTKTVFALTFADSIPTPKSVKRDPTYTPARYFEQRSQEWEEHIRRVFRDQICEPAISAATMFPTSRDSGDKLPNGVEWFDVAWSNIAVTAERQISGLELPSPLCIPIWKSWHVVFIISMVAGSFLGLFLGLCIGATFGAPERSQGIDFGTSVGGFLGALAGALIGLEGVKCIRSTLWAGSLEESTSCYRMCMVSTRAIA